MLDIAENSVRAGASHVELEITDSLSEDRLAFRIRDNGGGIDIQCKDADSFYTSKEGKRFGLGIPLLAQAAELCDGSFEVGPIAGGGTEMRVEFRRSHIDLMPVGDVGATVAVLVGGHPDIDFDVVVIRDSGEFRFSTARLREELEGLALNVPQVLEYIRQEIQEAFRRQDG